jgi:hypothetical protein
MLYEDSRGPRDFLSWWGSGLRILLHSYKTKCSVLALSILSIFCQAFCIEQYLLRACHVQRTVRYWINKMSQSCKLSRISHAICMFSSSLGFQCWSYLWRKTTRGNKEQGSLDCFCPLYQTPFIPVISSSIISKHALSVRLWPKCHGWVVF